MFTIDKHWQSLLHCIVAFYLFINHAQSWAGVTGVGHTNVKQVDTNRANMDFDFVIIKVVWLLVQVIEFISMFISIFISIQKYLNSSKSRKKYWKYQNQANWSKYFNSTNPPQLSYSMDPKKFLEINNH